MLRRRVSEKLKEKIYQIPYPPIGLKYFWPGQIGLYVHGSKGKISSKKTCTENLLMVLDTSEFFLTERTVSK